MIVSPSIGTRAYGNYPPRFRHLVVHLSESRGHLIGEGARHSHEIRLPGRGSFRVYRDVYLYASWGLDKYDAQIKGEILSYIQEKQFTGATFIALIPQIPSLETYFENEGTCGVLVTLVIQARRKKHFKILPTSTMKQSPKPTLPSTSEISFLFQVNPSWSHSFHIWKLRILRERVRISICH